MWVFEIVAAYETAVVTERGAGSVALAKLSWLRKADVRSPVNAG